MAAMVGGGAATLTNLGVTGARVATAPANVASVGVFGLIWNCGEMIVSFLLLVLGAICVYAGWAIAAFILVSLLTLAVVAAVRGLTRLTRRSQPVTS
jgi:uncharacterized membrane protein YciS (DUF1049 family)